MSKQLPESSPDTPLPVVRRHPFLRALVWISISVFALIVLLLITASTLLKSTRFHEYLRATIEQQAAKSLGVQVELENFTVHLSTLSLDLYGVTVHGAAPYVDPPLLQVNHAEVGVRVVSFLQRKWYLDEIRIDRPIAHIFTDAHGVSNIPIFKSSGNSNNTSIFDFGIRHAILDQGEIYYNDKQSAVAADLRNLDLRATFDPSQLKYSGKLSYDDGHLIAGAYQPIPHNLSLVFDATPSAFHLTQAILVSGPSRGMFTAVVDNYAHPDVHATYDLNVDVSQLQQLLANRFIPSGLVRATGTLDSRELPGHPILDAIAVNGDLNSRELRIQSGSMRAQAANLLGHYALANGSFTLHDLRANILGGQFTASGMMSSIDGSAAEAHSQMKASLRNVSLAQLRRMVAPGAAADVAVIGVLNAEANATWGKTFNDLVARTDATIDGSASHAAHTPHGNSMSAGNGSVVPIDSVIHGTYTALNQQLSFSQSYLRTPQTSLTLNGTVSRSSSLNVSMQSNDLGEIETIAALFRTPEQGQTVQPLGLAGTATFQGTVTGSISAPLIAGQLNAANVQVNGTSWRVLRAHVDANPSSFSIKNGDLQPSTRGHITFNASAGLDHWAFGNSSPVQVDLEAKQLSVADLEKLSGQQIPVTATLDANVKAHGTILNPIGQGNFAFTHIVAYDEPIQSASVDFTATGDQVHANLALVLFAGSLHGNVTVHPQFKSYVAELSTTGIQLDQLAALKNKNLGAKGVLTLKATGQGTFDNPQADIELQIPRLVVEQQTITGVALRMNVMDHVATANLVSSAINTSIRANAKVSMNGDYLADATLDTQSIPLQPLVAVYAPEQAASLSGQTEIHATLHGPLKNPKMLEAHVTVPVLKVAYGSTIQLAAVSPIRVDLKDQIVSLRRATIQGTGTNLQLQGTVPISGNGPMALLMLGTVDLQLAQLFVPDVRSSGQLKFNVNSNGPANAYDIGGQIEIVDANFASADLPVALQHGNGVLTLTRDRINIAKFQGTVGGGTVSARGGVVYQPKLQFELGLNAQNIRALYPQGMRESVNADIRLNGNLDSAVLGGQVALTDISFTPAFDLNSFISQFSSGAVSAPSMGFTQNLQLNIGVRSENDIRLASRALSINGSANLQVRGTAAEPVILGRVNLANGDIILNGDRFVLNGGTIEFVNPSQTEPVVNLSMNTTIQQYNIGLRFNGPIEQMHTNYSSDPSLPTADIINLLAFGETTEASAANATPANQAAESAIASQVSSQVTSRISKIAGISQLSINPVLAGGSSQGSLDANITIQQRVTGNLFVTFSSNVASTQNQTISGQYQLTPRVAVSATRDQNGGFAFDTSIKKSW